MHQFYQPLKNKLNAFVLNEIDNGQVTDVQIAKMLLEVSMHYLKHPTISKKDYDGDEIRALSSCTV